MEDIMSHRQEIILNRLYKFFPKDFEEYNTGVRRAMEEYADAYDVVKVEYRITPSPALPFADRVPRYALLYENDKISADKPFLFCYPFADRGEICFSVWFVEGRTPSVSEQYKLDFILRQLFNILSALVLEYACRLLTLTDPGTGIANLEAYMRFAGGCLAQGGLTQYTALYFNIHNFKSVHKSLTYLEGNEVLKRYCEIVSNAVTKREIVARLGGDNFVALILNSNMDYFLDLVQNMVVCYEKEEQNHIFMFGATVGAATLAEIRNPGQIMMRISAAYQSARDSRVGLRYYDSKANRVAMERKMILSGFMQAINDREFFVVYQPKVDVKTRSVSGAEALVRWRHGDGDVMPGSFIPVLEKDGCITVLDFYVLEEVCKFQQRLEREGLERVRISVNFSKRHLTNNKLVEEIVEIIDRYEVPHEYIVVELTESEDFNNYAVMQDIVSELNYFGIKTSIDDFGTGYSSLSMLRTLQVDELKIDRSFIPAPDVQSGDKSILMLKGVVGLAKSLGLTIVAEGVETPGQLEIIEGMECDIVQGYIFDKPLAQDVFVERIRRKYYELGGSVA